MRKKSSGNLIPTKKKPQGEVPSGSYSFWNKTLRFFTGKTVKFIFIVVAALGAILIFSLFLKQFTGIDLLVSSSPGSRWYKLGLAALAVIILVKLIQGATSLDVIIRAMKPILYSCIIMFVVTCIWNVFQPEREASIKTATEIVKDKYLSGKVKADGGEKITKSITVFEKTYTWEDVKDEKAGNIDTINLGVDDVRAGDTLEIIATVIGQDYFSGPEIGKWQGKNVSPKWAMTKNGYYKVVIEQITNGPLVISMNDRRDVKVVVRVTRTLV